MKTDLYTRSEERGEQCGAEKKPYRKPRVLSCEALQVIAATCSPGKSIFDCGIEGFDACCANPNS